MLRESDLNADMTCVEIDRGTRGVVKVRDSKSRAVVLRFTTREWHAFILGAKRNI